MSTQATPTKRVGNYKGSVAGRCAAHQPRLAGYVDKDGNARYVIQCERCKAVMGGPFYMVWDGMTYDQISMATKPKSVLPD